MEPDPNSTMLHTKENKVLTSIPVLPGWVNDKVMDAIKRHQQTNYKHRPINCYAKEGIWYRNGRLWLPPSVRDFVLNNARKQYRIDRAPTKMILNLKTMCFGTSCQKYISFKTRLREVEKLLQSDSESDADEDEYSEFTKEKPSDSNKVLRVTLNKEQKESVRSNSTPKHNGTNCSSKNSNQSDCNAPKSDTRRGSEKELRECEHSRRKNVQQRNPTRKELLQNKQSLMAGHYSDMITKNTKMVLLENETEDKVLLQTASESQVPFIVVERKLMNKAFLRLYRSYGYKYVENIRTIATNNQSNNKRYFIFKKSNLNHRIMFQTENDVIIGKFEDKVKELVNRLAEMIRLEETTKLKEVVFNKNKSTKVVMKDLVTKEITIDEDESNDLNQVESSSSLIFTSDLKTNSKPQTDTESCDSESLLSLDDEVSINASNLKEVNLDNEIIIEENDKFKIELQDSMKFEKQFHLDENKMLENFQGGIEKNRTFESKHFNHQEKNNNELKVQSQISVEKFYCKNL